MRGDERVRERFDAWRATAHARPPAFGRTGPATALVLLLGCGHDPAPPADIDPDPSGLTAAPFPDLADPDAADSDSDVVDTSPDEVESPPGDTDLGPWVQTTGPLPPPPQPARCVIPAPGSLASMGAITELHITQRVLMSDSDPADPESLGDFGLGTAALGQPSLGVVPVLRDGRDQQWQEFTQLLDLRQLDGEALTGQLAVSRIDGYPGSFNDGPRGVMVGDLDGDGDDEWLATYLYNDPVAPGVANQLAAWAQPFPRHGDVDGAQWRFWNSNWVNQWIVHHEVGDFNGDGFDDIYVAGNEVALGREDVFAAGPFGPPVRGQMVDLAPRTFATIRSNTFWATWTSTAAGDFNGDGVDDIAISGVRELPDVSVFFGPLVGDLDGRNPDMTFTSTRYPADYPYLRMYVITVGDLDGDGSDELAISAGHEEDNTGSVYIYRGPLRRGHDLLDTDAWARIRWIHPNSRTGTVMPVGDVNGDGRPDLVIRVNNATAALEIPGQELPVAPMPDGVEIPEYVDDTAADFYSAERALMLFTDWHPGDMGPSDAALVIRGTQAPATFALQATPTDDVDGDGMADFAADSIDLSYEPPKVVLNVIRPCRDFGELVGPLP